MYFSGFTFGFLILRVLANEYVGDLSNSASESVVAVNEPMKRNLSFQWRVARLVQTNPPTASLPQTNIFLIKRRMQFLFHEKEIGQICPTLCKKFSPESRSAELDERAERKTSYGHFKAQL